MPSFVTLNDGVRLSYTLSGSGPVLVIIHGWSGSHKSFQRNVQALSAHFTVVAYDQRFHGVSDKPQHGFHVARLAADLRAVIEQLQLSDVSLLGTSMVRCLLTGICLGPGSPHMTNKLRISLMISVDGSHHTLSSCMQAYACLMHVPRRNKRLLTERGFGGGNAMRADCGAKRRGARSSGAIWSSSEIWG